MELVVVYPSLLLLTFVLVLLLLKLTSLSHKPKGPKLPPGPWQLPIIGNIHQMLLQGSLPHRRLRDLSLVHGPIMHLKLGEVSTIVISSPEAAREIMKTHDVSFATRPIITAVEILTYGGKGLVFAPYGDFWRQMRKICVLELLSAKRVQSFCSIREEEVLNLVRSIASSGDQNESTTPLLVNLSKMLNSLANDITFRTVMGSKCADQAEFLSALNEGAEVAAGFDLADLFPSSSLVNLATRSRRLQIGRIQCKMEGTLNGVIHERKALRAAAGLNQSLEEDLLDVLLRLQEDGSLAVPLTSDNVKAVIQDIFGAGSETSSTALVWAMAELVRNPRVMKKAQSEVRGALRGNDHNMLTEEDVVPLGYLKLVIKETLRLHAPVPLLIPRECREMREVLGYKIPAKARVIVNAWAMGRDARWWGEDAEEFKPERFEESSVDFKGTDFEFIPFGAGRRMCPGISSAEANIEIALAQLLCCFDWELPGNAQPGDLDMKEKFGLTTPKRSDLCLYAIPRVRLP